MARVASSRAQCYQVHATDYYRENETLGIVDKILLLLLLRSGK